MSYSDHVRPPTSMHAARQQLSLYVPDESAHDLEAVRRAVDPIQHGLIPAHLTLCREDELIAWPPTHARLRAIALPRVTLVFGRAERFSGHGMILRCLDGQSAFRALREHLLGSGRGSRPRASPPARRPRSGPPRIRW